MSVSDDFSTGTLESQWTVAGPAGTSAGVGANATDGYLELVTPDGDHNVWGGANDGVRAMQATADTDFTLEAGFLTTPTERYQMHGFLVEQDAANWLRFDIHSDGSQLYAFAAVIENDTGAGQFAVAIPDATAYLRVVREGDLWTLQHSADGAAWATAGSFTHAMTAASAGVFAGNVGDAAGYTARVDYFEVGSDPIADEDAGLVPVNQAPAADDDALAADAGQALVIDVAGDLLGNDSDPDGDALSLAGFGQPASGTLVDNGDGTLTYTPDPGFSGEDSFTYTVTDGERTDTAAVTVTVAPAPAEPTTLVSDDFSDGTLSGLWSFSGPAGTSADVASTASDGFAFLSVPAGDHNVYGSNNGARLMQAANDTDFTLSARFLSTPSEAYELQGFLVEQDAGNWIRFDIYSNGARLYAFAATTVDGTSQTRLNVALPGTEVPYMRVVREGDGWTLLHSTDGATWTAAGSFDHAMTVTAAGLLAGATEGAGGYTAQVDWVEVASDPIADEDATLAQVNQAPAASDDALAVDEGQALVIDVAGDLLGNDEDINGDALSLAGFGQPASGSLVDNGDGTLTYTPDPGHVGPDSFSYTVTDGELTDTATVTVRTNAPPSVIASDDFADGALGAPWTFVGPTGTDQAIATTATESFLALITPEGAHSLWGSENGAARAMQNVTNGDLEVEARFLSTPTERFQQQGILVEEDALNWIRFETYSDGSTLYAFAASTADGASSARLKVAIPEGAAPYLRVARVEDDWTLSYSSDGETWVEAGSFTHVLDLSAIGPYAASTEGSGGYTATVDYFESLSDPIADEDLSFVPVAYAPEARDDSFAMEQDATLTIDVAADLLANDDDLNEDPLSLLSLTQPGNGTLVDNGDGTLAYTPDPGFTGRDEFGYVVTDGALSDGATAGIRVIGPPSVIASEDFSDGAIPAGWRFEGQAETEGFLATTDTEAFLVLQTPEGTFDLNDATRSAPRLMQDVTDGNLEVEVRYLSAPTERFQTQGILVEQDAANWVRFDTYSNGSSLFGFAGITVDGVTYKVLNTALPVAEAPHLRVTRDVDTWTFAYSADGASWTTIGTFDHELVVQSVGPWAASSSTAPGYTAKIDYFESTFDPIAAEDDTIVPVNVAPVARDDLFVAEVDGAVTLDVEADLFANDEDVNEDALSLAGLVQPASGTLVDNGDGTLTYTPDPGFEGFDRFDYEVSDGTLSDVGTVKLIVGNPIDVWYGEEQTFGTPGETQTWANILGNVPLEQLVGLSYSLNGGPSTPLALGPDTRRLQEPGDFNVDLAFSELDGSAADDVVRLTAEYADGSVYTRDVTIAYEAGNRYPADYAVDWSTVSDIQQVAQVVDGKWGLTGDGIRVQEPGYDRFVTVGDKHWDFYELTTSVTTHDLTSEDPRGRDGGVFGFGMVWGGHTDDPIPGGDPKEGWNPSELIIYDSTPNEHFRFFGRSGTEPYDLDEDKSYEFKLRVEQSGAFDRTYKMKVWEVGTAEPVDWFIDRTVAYDEPLTGSLMLLTHYYDVTFHDLAVTEIGGGDIAKGSGGADTLSAVDPAAPAPGRGEIDVLVGEGGADMFVLGDEDGIHYDDGLAASAGEDDYALLWDFVSGLDQIRLSGSAADYRLSEDAPGLEAGTAIWHLGEAGEADELVGIVGNSYGMALASADFDFVSGLA